MVPCLTMNHFEYSARANVELLRKHSHRYQAACVEQTNISRFLRSQLGRANLFTTCGALGVLAQAVSIARCTSLWIQARRIAIAFRRTAFPRHVARVVCMTAQKEMIRSYTQPIITVMANQQLRRNGADYQFIGKSMCPHADTISHKLAIGVGLPPSPPPAFARSIDARPELGNDIRGILALHPESPLVGAMPGTVSAVAGPSHASSIARVEAA